MGGLLELAQRDRESVLPILASHVLPSLSLRQVQKTWMLVNTVMHDLACDSGTFWQRLYISSHHSICTVSTVPLRYETTNRTWDVHQQSTRIGSKETMMMYPSCIRPSLRALLSKIGEHIYHLGIQADKLQFGAEQIVDLLTHTHNLSSFHIIGLSEGITAVLRTLYKNCGETITTISILNCDNLKDEDLENILPRFKNLKSINIQGVQNDSISGAFATSLESVTEYILTNPTITDANVLSVFERFGKNITRFYFNDNILLSTITECLNRAPNLTEIGISKAIPAHVIFENPNITSVLEGLTHMTINNIKSEAELNDVFQNDVTMKHLRHLRFANSEEFNGAIPSIAFKWDQLVELDMGTVPDLSEDVLEKICQSCPKLQVLRIHSFRTAFAYLPTYCCDIRIVDVFEAYGSNSKMRTFAEQCDIIAVLLFLFTHRHMVYRLKEINNQPDCMNLSHGLATIYDIYIGSVIVGSVQEATDDVERFRQIDNYLKEKRTQKEFRVLTEHGQIQELKASRYLKSVLY